MSPFFFEHFLTFWYHEMLQVYPVFFLPQTWDHPLLQVALVPFGRTVFRNQHLSAKCAHCYWSIVASRTSQWLELGEKYILAHVYTHLYFSITLTIHILLKNHVFMLILSISVQYWSIYPSPPLSLFVTSFSDRNLALFIYTIIS